jgi:hypothetical protein
MRNILGIIAMAIIGAVIYLSERTNALPGRRVFGLYENGSRYRRSRVYWKLLRAAMP